MKAILLLAASFFFLVSCTKEELDPQTDNSSTSKLGYNLAENIKSIHFTNWISGVRGGGSGTDFYIELKAPLPREVTFNYLYFKDKAAHVNVLSPTVFVSNFSGFGVNMGDEIPYEETARQVVMTGSAPITIGEEDALLEYTIGEEINYYFISKPAEVESDFLPQ